MHGITDATTRRASQQVGTIVPHRLLAVVGFLTIAGQRVGLPVGETHLTLTLIALVALYAYLLMICGWKLSGIGLGLWGSLVLLGLVSLLVHSEASFPSLAVLILCYAPLLFLPGVNAGTMGAGQSFFNGAVAAIKAGAIFALVQAVLQWGGSTSLWDPLAKYLPSALFVDGYNTNYDLTYVDQDLGLNFKPNGAIFLEPSMLSLYCGIALIWLAHQYIYRPTSRPAWPVLWFAVLSLAIVLSISTSALPILAIGMLPLVVSVLRSGRLVATLIAGSAVGAALGVFGPIVDKAFEGFGASSSTGLRLVLPWELLAPFTAESPIIGLGPGTSEQLVRAVGVGGLQVPTPLKVALEYGFLGAGLLALAVLVMWHASRAPAAIGLAVLAAWLIPAEALLNPALVGLLFFAVAHYGSYLGEERRDRAGRGSGRSLGC